MSLGVPGRDAGGHLRAGDNRHVVGLDAEGARVLSLPGI